MATIQEQDIFHIVDSTKLKCFMSCPRKYFYEYILHWRRDKPNIHLEFGTAWHLAKEYLFIHGVKKENIEPAYDLFLSHYRKYFPEPTDMDMAPKNPGNCLAALSEYVAMHYDQDSLWKVLYTEIVGTVPISGTHQMSFKIDAVIEDEYGIWVVDHKTGSRLTTTWSKQWLLSTQMWVYIHALQSFMADRNIQGAIVDGTILRKKGNAHERVPVRHSSGSMQAMYWSVVHALDMIQWNHARMDECTPGDAVLEAFPMCTESCTQYGECPYMDFCVAWGNPLQHCDEPPIGYRVEVWNPHKDEDTASHTLRDGVLTVRETKV